MQQPQFTIAIPVYNGEAYIAQTIQSLLAQTYPYFDIVVLENGSTDQTIPIVMSFADPRIQILSSGQLLPIEQNWARILDIPNPHEFLVLMCADDILYPQFLSRIADAISQHPTASLYHAQTLIIDSQGQFIDDFASGNYQETAEDFLDAVHAFRQSVFGTGYVMRFADFKAVGGYPNYSKLLFSDIFCYYRLTKKSYKICVQEPLVGFRRHASSTGFNAHTREFESAAVDYLRDLQNAGYLTTPQHEQMTRLFVRFVSGSGLRQFIHDLIKETHDPNRAKAVTTQESLPNALKQRRMFLWDVSLNWYLYIATIVNPVLRLSIYYGILAIIRLRRAYYVRNRRYQLKSLLHPKG